MATIPVEFPVKTPNTGPIINQFKLLKNELREAKGELAGLQQGTEAFARQAAKVGQINDKIKDLNASVSAVSGEPIENLTGSFSLLRSQVETLDFKGATSSLQSLSGIVSGLNFGALTEGVKAFGAAMLSLGKALLTNPIFILAAAIAGVVGAWKLWNDELSESAEKDKALNEQLKIQLRLQNSIVNEIERGARIRKALGLTEAQNKKAELQDEIKLYSAIRTRQVLLADISNKSEEQWQELKALNKQEADSYNNITALRIELDHAITEEAKKEQDERNKLAKEKREREKKDLEDFMRDIEDLNKWLLEQANIAAKQVTEIYAQQARDRKNLDDLIKEGAFEDDIDKLYKQLSEEQDAKDEAERKGQKQADQISKQNIQRAKEEAAAKNQIESDYFDSIGNLADIYFNIQLASAAGNEVKMEEIRKRQFNVDKAVKASQATIDGFKAVTATLAQGGAFAIPLAVSTGILAFTNVVKILSTQYKGGAGGSASASGGAPVGGQAPINTVTTPTTQIRPQGQGANNRVYVLESDIKKSNNRVSVLESRATF